MLDRRSKGLLALHGCCVLLALPTLFTAMAMIGVNTSPRYSYDYINFPLYLMGIGACALIFFNFYGLLAPGMFQRRSTRVFQVTNLQTVILLTMLFGIIFATKDKAISRIFVGTYLLLSYVMLFALNSYLPRAISRLLFKGDNLRRCLVVGRAEEFEAMREWFQTKENLGLTVAGLVNPGTDTSHPAGSLESPYAGNMRQLRELARERFANQLILLETRQSKRWVNEVMRVAEQEGCQLMIYNPWADFFEKPLISMKDGPHTFFIPREEPLESPLNRLLKRLLDLTVSIPVIMLTLPPLTLWVWLRQRRESPGPVFFRQRRRGHNRSEFTIYKFRTMHADHGEEARQATRDDQRIYAFGLFLRRTSLDEIPQFWNVFRGNMSIVGPRPHLPEHDALFAKVVGPYAQRHFVKPGITGLAQCMGYRGEITDPELLRRRVQYDLEYMNDWSLLLDLEIMVRTANIVLHPPETAY